MKLHMTQHHVTIAAFLLVSAIGAPLMAQTPVRVNMPGTAFTPEGSGSQVVVDDVPGGRRFRGKADALLKLRAVLRMPPSSSAEPKMQRLVIHFRTSPEGPSLRSVEVFNGATAEFRITTMLKGDYTARETMAPDFTANAWDLKSSPIAVSSQSLIRLTVRFPTGFDSPHINPGEFVITAVQVDFPRKERFGERVLSGGHSWLSEASQGVIYAVANNDDLLWYRHDGQSDGSRRWTDPKQVGNGWGFKQLFSGGAGIIYAITAGGDLLWYRHNGHDDGSRRWTDPKQVGNGWNFKQVFSGEGGVIYAITASGDLLWYRHDGYRDGSNRWTNPKQIGNGWNFKQVFSAEGGVIYAITASGDLLWYRHDGYRDGSNRWTNPKQVGNGWNFKEVFYGGRGVIYAITANGFLVWYRHDGYSDGSNRWTNPKQVGNGWNFKFVFADEPGL